MKPYGTASRDDVASRREPRARGDKGSRHLAALSFALFTAMSLACCMALYHSQYSQEGLHPLQETALSAQSSNNIVMIKMVGKNNLCLDDSGADKEGEAQVKQWTCDPKNLNQQFIYDVTTKQFRSVRQPKLCLDDGGSMKAGEKQFTMWKCDRNNVNQRFVYNAARKSFYNPAKPSLCMDDGGGTTPGSSKFTLWTCDASNVNQKFQILKQKELEAQVYPTDPALHAGEKVMIKMVGKNNLCLDESGADKEGEAQVKQWTCDPKNLNQQFIYDASTSQLRSVRQPTWCLDDGGTMTAGEKRFTMWTCDPNNANQRFVYDPVKQSFHNPGKPSLCMDDGGGTTRGSTKFTLWTCDISNPNQKFEILKQKELEAKVYPTDAALHAGEKVLIKIVGKDNLCVDDSGAGKIGEGQVTHWTCDPKNPNQQFIYDASTSQFRSVRQPTWCLDDGGTMTAGEKRFTMWTCDPNNVNQRFVYNAATESFYNPAKPSLCMDDGGGTTPGSSQFTLWTCDDTNVNQQFVVVEVNRKRDWNLLAPSHETVNGVDADRSSLVSREEVFKFLEGVKSEAQREYEDALASYNRTQLCVIEGLKHLGKDVLSHREYRALVRWMYVHCPVHPTDAATAAPNSTHMYMTKLEFYHKIKAHFMQQTNTIVGKIKDQQVHREIINARMQQLQDCIASAADRFGREREYENEEHFSAAIDWVMNTCASAPK